MSVRYRPGRWHAAVTPQGFALLPANLDLVLVEGIWGRVARGAGLGGVLEALTGAFGTSLSTIPPFAVVSHTGDDVRLAVRGNLSLVVQRTDASVETVSGLGVTTWSERIVQGVAGIDAGVEELEDTGFWLPVESAIVPAAAVRLRLRAIASGPIRLAAGAPSSGSVAARGGVAAAAAAGRGGATSDEPGERADSTPEGADAGDSSTAAEAVVAVDAADALEAVVLAAPAGDETWVPSVETARIDETPTDTAAADDYDHLWGATVVTPVQAAAVIPPAPADPDAPVAAASPATPDAPTAPAAPSPSEAPSPGDHDGETMFFAQARALRDASPDRSAGRSATEVSSEEQAASTGAAAEAPSAPGWIELSTGEHVVLDRPIVVGRRPRAVRVTGDLPHLVAVPSPQQDISRSHIEIRSEGDATLVVDLDTTNGSVLHRAGSAPVRLHPGDPTMLIDGDVVDLGDGVTVTVRGIR